VIGLAQRLLDGRVFDVFERLPGKWQGIDGLRPSVLFEEEDMFGAHLP
jgi:hypothetical protein